ncbi:MAG: 16S rRNA (guanine(966)-N(2))-methyltransferase RsmD [Erysipelotrichaceae bacterium]|nr:16S rRNA (guanine(966)-N(2))-methyltransferase RsmD [Erysipelotrichaceae bacterium]
MRVIAGKYRSRQLKTVDSKLTRPTTDKNKENLFNIIGPYFDGGVVLDLFAGSGGLGIEAISRGMDELYSVDKQYKAFRTIQDNIKSLGIDNAHVYKRDYRQFLNELDANIKFDLVLLDPPYDMGVNMDIIKQLASEHHLNDGAVIVIEDLKENRLTFENPFYLYREKEYGITIVQIVDYKEADNG